MVVISASGMATGGRVVHHLRRFAPDPASTILLAGFQAAGTRGAALAGGAAELKFFGQYVPVRAEVASGPAFWQTQEIELCPPLIAASVSALEAFS